MSKFRLIIIALVFVVFWQDSYATNKSSKSKNKSFKTTNSIINSKKLRVTKSELRLAKNIATIYDIALKGYVNKNLVKKLLKKSAKNKTFSIYHQWLKNIHTINQARSFKTIKKVCKNIANTNSKNPTVSSLLANNKRFCFQKYLDKFSLKRLRFKNLKKENLYFQKYISNFTSKNNLGELKYLLGRYKNSPKRLSVLSKSISQYYMSNNSTPPTSLMQYMHIDYELTRYIQIKGIHKNSTQRILHKEFKVLVDNVYQAAEKNLADDIVSDKLNKAINYYTLSKSHLPINSSSLKLLGIGKSLTRRSYFISARKAFSTLVQHSPRYKSDAIFELLWTYVTTESYDEAFEDVIEKYQLHKNYKNLSDSKLKFWIAITLKEDGQGDYDKILQDIITKDPVSYYAIISSKYLEKFNKMSSNKTYMKMLNKNSQPRIFTNIKLDEYTLRALKRLKIWSKLDFKPFIRTAIKTLSSTYAEELTRINKNITLKQASSLISFLSAKTIATTGNHLESFKIVYRNINRQNFKLDKEILNILYPKPFWKKIKRYTKGFDPIIALSLIRQESAFNTRVRSHVGARGLMQIMPNTAKQFQRRIKAKALFNANRNIKIGTKYLSNLMKSYEQNLVYTLSAYNAGEGRVKRWRNKYLLSDSILHNIENIPFSETRKYVKLIFRNIFFYKLLNEENAKRKLANTKSPNKMFDIYLGFNR